MRRAGAPRRKVVRIARAGSFASQCSPNRHDTNRQKSVPLPNRRTIRNNSTKGDISQPSLAAQASSPRAITTHIPIVSSGTIVSQIERYTIIRTPRRRTTVAIAARSSEIWTFLM